MKILENSINIDLDDWTDTEVFSIYCNEINGNVMKDRKTHENLKEKAFDQFKEDLAHEENKVVDEIVSYSYHKKKK